MNKYIGTKLIKAKPMTRADYNKLRGWKLPDDENGSDPGYLVEYLDGGKPNLDGYDGYVSWSPKEQFDNAYREVSGLNFGLAIEAMKKGLKVARKGWNGKDMWIAITPYSSIPFKYIEEGRGATSHRAKEDNIDIKLNAHIDMRASDGSIVVGWLASQTDMLSDDWFIVD